MNDLSGEAKLDLGNVEPARNMHKLMSITLINWYLFDVQTIVVNGGSLLIRGVNGAGKSSILDGFQTVLAGANESLLMMNAASSDGKRSGRSIRTYVLGEVAESPGMHACEPRTVSNSYLVLNFISKTGKPFCFGMGFYARSSDSKRLDKHWFIIDGYNTQESDFLEGENTVITWGDFEQRLKHMPGAAKLPSTGKSFCEEYCGLLSAPGAAHYISPAMMFRVIRNSLTFREQKDISEFTREYILPQEHIDVVRIENDFKEYTRIQEIIINARERLDCLNEIVNLLERFQSKQQRSLGYRWAQYEAEISFYDIEAELLVAKRDKSIKTLELTKRQLFDIESKLPALRKQRDEALLTYRNSEGQQALSICNQKITDITSVINRESQYLDSSRSLLVQIEKTLFPHFGPAELRDDFNAAREILQTATGFDVRDKSRQWPSSVPDIHDVQAALEIYSELSEQITIFRDEVKAEFDGVNERITLLREAISKSEVGEAKLMRRTEDAIDLFAQHGITALPVCNMATISDDLWQEGIERFLGGNRESLFITDALGNVEGGRDRFDLALKIYRDAKAQNKELRQVKLINPDKLFGHAESPAPTYAGHLIQSDDPIVLRYLRGLLKNVKLVETEDELRNERRAITRDGMIAGNGSIGGGGFFNWILIGHEARKKHVIRLIDELAALQPEYNRLKGEVSELDQVKTMLFGKLPQAIEHCEGTEKSYNAISHAHRKMDELLLEKARLEENTDSSLQAVFEEVDGRLNQAENEKLNCSRELTQAENELAQIVGDQASGVIGSLPKIENTIKELADRRRQITGESGYNDQVANGIFEALCNKHQEDYQIIAKEAELQFNSNRDLSSDAREKGVRAITAFCHKYDPEDKDELAAMDPLDALQRCQEHANRIVQAEIIVYELEAQEAREKMLINFRSEVVAKLKECFARIEETFRTLNRTLSDLLFNSNRYRFQYPLTEVETLRTIHDYVVDTSDLEMNSVGDMFDTDSEHPAVKLIQSILEDGRLKEISDYRNFYSYDIVAKNVETDTERKFSELLSVGSGGEKQAPFYVALGASFMTAYKIRKVGDTVFGGVAMALFDEAFSKMDGNNAKSALQFFQDIGLQVILAAPPESEIKVGPYVNRTVNVIRSGDNIYIDDKTYMEKGRTILESDNPHIHPEIVKPYEEALKKVNPVG